MKFNVNETIDFLVNADIKVTGRLVDASNATLYATASVGDKEIACIYKPIAGERPLWDFQEGDLASREVASFKVSNALGLDLVPPTVLRDGPYGRGMVQAWVDIDTDIDLMEYFQQDLPELKKLALFDALINNTDRKIGHLLPTKDGHLYACDHGVTFHKDEKLRTVLWQWAGEQFSDDEMSVLHNASAVLPGIDLDELITNEELLALNKRLERLIDEGKFPTPSEEWPSVPWPPF